VSKKKKSGQFWSLFFFLFVKDKENPSLIWEKVCL